MNPNSLNKNKVFTIPNLLSFARILLIPVFIYFYIYQEKYLYSSLVLVLSGVTDVIDGFIARSFNMISNLGRILDPIADKLTQAAVLCCLIIKFPYMLGLLILLLIKDISLGIFGLIFIKRNKQCINSVWHGKLAALSLYLMMFVHIVVPNISQNISYFLMLISLVMMLMSLILYAKYFIRLTYETNENQENK
ncbi:MAG: CDP-alcohol phosphatidyltransferase family protein [Bacilli bacterium]|nr:CDP-alcohol phosphatidyltransferase family protein [Bacilli bacterium]